MEHNTQPAQNRPHFSGRYLGRHGFVNNKPTHLPNPRIRIKGKRISGKGIGYGLEVAPE